MVAEDVGRLRAQFQQELDHPHHKVGIPPQRELLAVQPSVRIGNHVHQTTAFDFQRGRNRLASDFGYLHQEGIGPFQAHRDVQLGNVVLPSTLDELLGLLQLPRLQQDSVVGIGRVLDFVLGGAARIHAELTVSGGVQHFGRIAQQGMRHTHLVEHAMDHAEVAQIRFKTRHQIELAIFTRFFALHGVEGEVAGDAFEHVVPTRGVATDEARRVGEGGREFLRDMAFLLGIVDKGIQVVADDFRHTGGGNRDHVWLV